MTRLLPLFCILVVACKDAPQKPTAPLPRNDYEQAHVLKTYRVPAGHVKTLERVLRGTSYPVQVVSQQGTQTQFVRLNPQITGDGHFLLSAPMGIHDGVRELIAQLDKSPPKAAPSTIESTYWIVLAWSDAQTTIAPELKDVEPALKGLDALGPQRFELLDRLQIAALDGEEAEANGNTVEKIRSTASTDGSVVELRLAIKIGGGTTPTGLETNVTVKPGQFAVLGQAGYITAKQAKRATLLFIVRTRTLL